MAELSISPVSMVLKVIIELNRAMTKACTTRDYRQELNFGPANLETATIKSEHYQHLLWQMQLP